jgi:glycosyltransferase involved in cell wall biosynthesis
MSALAHIKPTVSICMPAYNAEAFIAEALDSVLRQSFKDFELIVIDDGSEDGTGAIIEEYASRDKRVKALQNSENRGLVFTRNRALSECSAPLVACADADDVLHPQRLEKQVAFMQQHPEIGVLGTAVNFIGCQESARPNGAICSEDRNIRLFLRFGPCLWNTATVYRRALMLESGGYREEYKDGAEDYDLWARLLDRTRMANLSEALVTVRLHSSSVTARGTKWRQNVLGISARLLTVYLGKSIEASARDELHEYFMHQGMQRESCHRAFVLARALYGRAQRSEQQDTLRLLAAKCAQAAWTQANYNVYVSRSMSLRLALYATGLTPALLGQLDYYRYLCRWLLPNGIRRWLKRFSRTPLPAC